MESVKTQVDKLEQRIAFLEDKLGQRVAFLENIIKRAGLLDEWQDLSQSARVLDIDAQFLRKMIRNRQLKNGEHWRYKPGSTRYYLINISAVQKYFNQESAGKSA